MCEQNTPDVTQTLHDLLQGAQMSSSDSSGPILLCCQNIFPSQIADVCFVESSRYYTDESDEGRGTITADKFIKQKLDAGFQVMSMAIVQKSYAAGGTEHVVMTVLVKLKTE